MKSKKNEKNETTCEFDYQMKTDNMLLLTIQSNWLQT